MERKLNRIQPRTGMYTCNACGRKTRETGDGAGVGLCEICYEYAGMENTHSDYSHDSLMNDETYGKEYGPQIVCPVCLGITDKAYRAGNGNIDKILQAEGVTREQALAAHVDRIKQKMLEEKANDKLMQTIFPDKVSQVDKAYKPKIHTPKQLRTLEQPEISKEDAKRVLALIEAFKAATPEMRPQNRSTKKLAAWIRQAAHVK